MKRYLSGFVLKERLPSHTRYKWYPNLQPTIYETREAAEEAFLKLRRAGDRADWKIAHPPRAGGRP